MKTRMKGQSSKNKRQVFDHWFKVLNSLVSLGEISRAFTKDKFFSVENVLGDIYSYRGAEWGSVQSDKTSNNNFVSCSS